MIKQNNYSKESLELSFFIIAGWSSLVARRAHNPKVVGSNPAPAIAIEKLHTTKRNNGLVVQLVRMPACHAGGRGFESRPDRFVFGSVAQLVEQWIEAPCVGSSILSRAITPFAGVV